MKQALIFLGLTFYTCYAFAAIGRVYSPYVNPYESELDYQGIYDEGSETIPTDYARHVLGYGSGISDSVAAEVSVVFADNVFGNTLHRATELEVKWQMSEQGEYDFDWGAMFGVERNHQLDYWQVSSKLLIHKDFTDTSLTLNLISKYEWGPTIDNQFDGEVRGRFAWRTSRRFEPSLEFHSSESYTVMGPVIGGTFKVSPTDKLLWRTGILFGLDSFSPHQTLKLELEYEFF